MTTDNIKGIRLESYSYDTAGRLLRGTVNNGSSEQQYAYDSFGNQLSTETYVNGVSTEFRSTPADAGTNHMFGIGASCDAAGNLATWSGWTTQGQSYIYSYDPINNLTTLTGNGKDWTYFYDADDERIWSYNNITQKSRYRVRGVDSNKVLREFAREGWDLNNPFGAQGTWSWVEDWIWRDGASLLAGVSPTQTFFFHLDHLGTPRVVSTYGYGPYDTRTYYPFGEEATAQDSGNWDFMHYTAHERDVMAGERNSLDYMHARHYDAIPGRFLSTDPLNGSRFRPQSWNKYSYVGNNPVNFVDPFGLFWDPAFVKAYAGMDVCGNSSGCGDWFFGWSGMGNDTRTEKNGLLEAAKLSWKDFTNEFKQGGCVNDRRQTLLIRLRQAYRQRPNRPHSRWLHSNTTRRSGTQHCGRTSLVERVLFIP